MARIYIVEDSALIREAAAGYLRLDDHEVVECETLGEARERLRLKKADLIILDVMLADGNGFAFAKELRAESEVPILFLTARGEESDRITGFETGGDDYVVKPFSPRELMLRAKALLKRRHPKEESSALKRWHLGETTLSINEDAHSAIIEDTELKFTGAEWKILVFLAKQEDTVVSRERVLGECLGYDFEGSERTVDTHIANLRRKLSSSEWIETIRGYGYRFRGERE